MDVLASPSRAMVWVCPACGHGSPEQRDERAHLDAHRQLRQFFQDWDDAVHSDARATARRAGWRSARVWVAAILLVGASALAVVGLSGGEPPLPTTASGVAIPGVDLPRYDAVPLAPERSAPTTGPVPAPEPSSPASGPAHAAATGNRTSPSSAPAAPEPDEPGPVDRAPVPTTGGTGAAPTPAAPLPTPAASTHLVDACVLGLLCITLL